MFKNYLNSFKLFKDFKNIQFFKNYLNLNKKLKKIFNVVKIISIFCYLKKFCKLIFYLILY